MSNQRDITNSNSNSNNSSNSNNNGNSDYDSNDNRIVQIKNKSGRILNNYLSNIKVGLIVAAFTHCPENWRDIDYVPDYNKLYFICDGEGWLKVGVKEYYPQPGQLFFMPAGIKQSYSTISTNTFTKYWCHFTAKIGDINFFDIIKTPLFIDVENCNTLETLFKKLIGHYEGRGTASPLYAQAALMEIVAYFLESIPEDKIYLSSSSSIEKLSKILEYIESNITEDITIDQLAKMASFHPNYFIRFFKKNTGTSPAHYINKVKMDKAKNLLGITDLSVTSIGEAIGFSDVYHFSKIFKNYTGFSPTEYRKVFR
ncbi:MAG TPA: AraC family transcriptional regulator [Clostridiales bacterium]|nr:AraC family transcriptional regulator [Clostridiales bacterium]